MLKKRKKLRGSVAPEKQMFPYSEKQIRKVATETYKGPTVRLLCIYFNIFKFLLLF